MTDVGTWMVDSLFAQLMVDEQWASRHERGFTWWGYRLAQHIEVEKPAHRDGLDLCTLRIWTDVVRDVDPGTNPESLLAQVNFQTTLNALIWDPESATIAECCTVTVHQDNANWLSKVLATAAILQNTSAHSRAHGIARACNGVPAATNHPTSGTRSEMDDILNVPAQVIVPAGAEPSKFTGALCNNIAGFLAHYSGQMEWFGTADDTGATVEVPFSGTRPLMFQDPNATDTRSETTLVQIFTDQPHPEAGHGALLVSRLPISPGTEQALVLANQLNRAEFRGDLTTAPLLGSWCPDFLSEEGNGLAFCSFIPNLLAQPGILNNWILYQRTRSLYARDFLGI